MPAFPLPGAANCYGCGCRLFDPRLAGFDGGYCDACRPSPRDDGAWRVGERYDPFQRMHPQTRWWSYPLDRHDQVVYQYDGGLQTMQIALVTDTDIRDIRAETPLRSDHLYRVRITQEERWPNRGQHSNRLVTIPWLRIVLDVLAPAPPGDTIRCRWRQLTATGDTAYPRRQDNPEVRTSITTWPR